MKKVLLFGAGVVVGLLAGAFGAWNLMLSQNKGGG